MLLCGTLKRRKRPNKWETEPTSNIELDDCTAFLQKSTHFFRKKEKEKSYALSSWISIHLHIISIILPYYPYFQVYFTFFELLIFNN